MVFVVFLWFCWIMFLFGMREHHVYKFTPTWFREKKNSLCCTCNLFVRWFSKKKRQTLWCSLWNNLFPTNKMKSISILLLHAIWLIQVYILKTVITLECLVWARDCWKLFMCPLIRVLEAESKSPVICPGSHGLSLELEFESRLIPMLPVLHFIASNKRVLQHIF